MENEKEKEVLFFENDEYDFALAGLQELKKIAEYICLCWEVQPLLKKQPFTKEVMQGIIRHRATYIKDAIATVIKEAYEKTAPGMSDQIDIPEPTLKGVDEEKLERFADSATNYRPGSRSNHINIGMLDYHKGKFIISDLSIAKLKETFTTYNNSGQLAEAIEIGKVGEASINTLQKMIDKREKERQQLSGRKMFASATTMFEDKKTPGENWRGLFYKDMAGQWTLNVKQLKIKLL